METEKLLTREEKEKLKIFNQLPLFIRYVIGEKVALNFVINNTVKGTGFDYFLKFSGNFTIATKDYDVMTLGIIKENVTAIYNGIKFKDHNGLFMELLIPDTQIHEYIQWLAKHSPETKL